MLNKDSKAVIEIVEKVIADLDKEGRIYRTMLISDIEAIVLSTLQEFEKLNAKEAAIALVHDFSKKEVFDPPCKFKVGDRVKTKHLFSCGETRGTVSQIVRNIYQSGYRIEITFMDGIVVDGFSEESITLLESTGTQKTKEEFKEFKKEIRRRIHAEKERLVCMLVPKFPEQDPLRLRSYFLNLGLEELYLLNGRTRLLT
jgi:hypothetical protein